MWTIFLFDGGFILQEGNTQVLRSLVRPQHKEALFELLTREKLRENLTAASTLLDQLTDWTVCPDCGAHIEEEDHAAGCPYALLELAQEHLTLALGGPYAVESK